MSRMLKDKLCRTCISRYPEINDLRPRDTRPHQIPVVRCQMDHDVEYCGICEDYRNLWTGRGGDWGNRPKDRPEL